LGQAMLEGMEELAPAEGREQALAKQAEQWLETLRPGGGPGLFLDSYLSLRSVGWAWREAFCIAWLSLGRDDRGNLASVGDLCDFLGVSRMWFYEHKSRYEHEPAQGLNAWDWWAERLQLSRLRGQRLAEVDEAVYSRAVSEEGKAADRELYYRRARVLQAGPDVTVNVGQSVDVRQATDAELDAILRQVEGACNAPVRDDGEQGRV